MKILTQNNNTKCNAQNINANTDRSVNDWMRVARGFLTATAAKQLRLRDVFVPANEGVDFQSTNAGLKTPQIETDKITASQQIECTQNFNLAAGKEFKINNTEKII